MSVYAFCIIKYQVIHKTSNITYHNICDTYQVKMGQTILMSKRTRTVLCALKSNENYKVYIEFESEQFSLSDTWQSVYK